MAHPLAVMRPAGPLHDLALGSKRAERAPYRSGIADGSPEPPNCCASRIAPNEELRIAETTIRRDVECFVRTYLARIASGRGVHEDNLESPLSELALMQPVGVGSAFSFRRGPKPSLPDEVFLYGLLSFWRHIYPTRRELSAEAIAHEPGCPGRVFLLDEESVAERLAGIADLTKGAIRWDESTGMRQIYAQDMDAIDEFSLLRALYRRTSRARAA